MIKEDVHPIPQQRAQHHHRSSCGPANCYSGAATRWRWECLCFLDISTLKQGHSRWVSLHQSHELIVMRRSVGQCCKMEKTENLDRDKGTKVSSRNKKQWCFMKNQWTIGQPSAIAYYLENRMFITLSPSALWRGKLPKGEESWVIRTKYSWNYGTTLHFLAMTRRGRTRPNSNEITVRKKL